MRFPSDTDFSVQIEGVGSFRFARRTMAEEIRIQAEYAKYLNGADPTPWLASVAGWLATLRVLTVRAPDGWQPDELELLDPLDEQVYAKLSQIHGGLRDAEREFRRKPDARGQGARAQDDRDGGVGVSTPVPAQSA